MFKRPTVLSICMDNDFFGEISREEFRFEKSSFWDQDINCIINGYDMIVLSGENLLKDAFWDSWMKTTSIPVSLEIENDTFDIKNIEKYPMVYQIRYPVFFHAYIENRRYYSSFFRKLSYIQKENKIVIIYLDKRSSIYIDVIYDLADELLKMNIMMCVYILPFDFVKCEYALSKEMYWMVAKVVDQAVLKMGNHIYGDFPVAGSRYDRISGICPSLGMTVNLFCDGMYSPCRFTKINLGIHNVQSQQEIFDKWHNLQTSMNSTCFECSSFNMCKGGCIANWGVDQMDHYCEKIIREGVQ